jgi:putative transposase
MTLYKNKYRIESHRLKNWDYSSDGHYFITICTYNKIQYFGNVVNSKMIYSEIGKIVHHKWLKIPKRFKNATLDVFQIMPNHIHGIIIIENNISNERKTPKFSHAIPGFNIGYYRFVQIRHYKMVQQP